MFKLFNKLKSLKVFGTLMMIFIMAMPAFAQEATTIEFDPALLFSSVNEWIVIFLPIVAIGLGISIALAILGFIGREILKGFRGGGGK